MEKLYELHDRGGFDLIVVDTPPTRHALDFLDAPRRLTRMLDNRVFRILMVPTRTGAARRRRRRAGAAPHDLARRRHRTGRRRRVVLPRLRRAWRTASATVPQQVMQLLAADETAFVLVTSPRRDAVEEAEYFAERLADGEYAVDALVVNRVHPRYTDTSPDALRARVPSSRPARRVAAPRSRRATPTWPTSRRSRCGNAAELAGLEQRIGDASVAHVPELGHDVHDFGALRAVGSHLLAAD